MKRGPKSAILTLAALTALPLPAAAQEMCAALRRIAAAAEEPVPFASLRAGPLVPGYRNCRVDTPLGQRIGAIYCSTQMAPRSLIAETVGAQLRDCLHAEPVPGRFPGSALHFRTATLWISVASHCDEECHVGRLASLDFRRRGEGETGLPR